MFKHFCQTLNISPALSYRWLLSLIPCCISTDSTCTPSFLSFQIVSMHWRFQIYISDIYPSSKVQTHRSFLISSLGYLTDMSDATCPKQNLLFFYSVYTLFTFFLVSVSDDIITWYLKANIFDSNSLFLYSIFNLATNMAKISSHLFSKSIHPLHSSVPCVPLLLNLNGMLTSFFLLYRPHLKFHLFRTVFFEHLV